MAPDGRTARLLLAICLAAVSVTEQASITSYDKENNILQTFREWLDRQREGNHVDDRSDPQSDYRHNGQKLSEQSMDDYWQGLALQDELNHEGEVFNGELFVESEWPEQKVELGQVGGVATNQRGDAVIFHRADREWEEDSFKDNVYTKKDSGPIMEPTVVTMNRSNGAILDTWGQNLFYLPHGLTIDSNDNYWVTDVALHQVFKFGKNKAVPELTLGKAFEPAINNDDMERLCKPTDVAVTKDGTIFVADGYCNSRIVKYSSDGKLLNVFGQDDMWVPHSLALVEELDLICAADRENKRILCYNAGLNNDELLGYPNRAYTDKDVMGRVFAITYSKTAPSDDLPGTGFTIDLHTKDSSKNDIIAVWSPTEEGFEMPHDLDVTPDGDNVYVGEIGPNKVWKFDKTE
ncbi:hypothetical protein LSH36_722g01047 [Paralvinella palmiformis]|uniref:peptidylamidoglycolate lyase n=1 Tax=Paralvinella palmiformis TaxID=53620 RepID=A0AAD9J1L1_9ANNE|nr:hypothetical protein LSH36_722g01047 [Paralvinella palmiformis]